MWSFNSRGPAVLAVGAKGGRNPVVVGKDGQLPAVALDAGVCRAVQGEGKGQIQTETSYRELRAETEEAAWRYRHVVAEIDTLRVPLLRRYTDAQLIAGRS